MAYIINKSDGTVLTTLQDATINTDSSLTLVGRNYIGYGEIQNENFLFLLENFANTAAPTRPIAGQLWFDTTGKVLKAYDGTKWVEVGSATISQDPPENPPAGGFWFKSGSNTLHAWNGTEWSLIGPETAEGFGVTRARSTTLRSNAGIDYPVILITVADVVIAIVSSSPFTINTNPINAVPGFTTVEAGITLNSSVFINGRINGNAATATALESTRLINGRAFNGTQDITITANTSNNLQAGDHLIGNDFNGGATTVWSVDASSSNLIGKVVVRNSAGGFSAGLITANLAGNVTGNVTATQGTSRFNRIEANEFVGQNLAANAFSATKLQTPRNINGVAFDGLSDITVAAASNTLTGTDLAANVTGSQLESVGLLSSLDVNGLVTISSNLTIAASGNNSNITADNILKLTADDGTGTSVVDLISPATSVSEGYGAKGAIIPTVDQALDLGKSARKFDNVYANTFNGDLVGTADTATFATTATNIAGGASGSIAYQTASGATALLPVGAAGNMLLSTGSTIQWSGDIGVINSEIVNNLPMKLVSKTVTELGSLAASTGSMVFCTDESAGSIPAFYDGSNWRRVSDRAIVS
jgi:hypothetical protein